MGFPKFLFWFLLKEHCNTGFIWAMWGDAGVLTQLAELRDMRGRQGKLWILRMHIRPFYPTLCLHWQRFSLSCPITLCLLGSAVLWRAHWYLVHVESALIQWMTSPASVSPAGMNDDQHKGIKIIPQFLNLFNPLLCIPLGSLPSLGASSSSFRRILSFSSESCWTVEPLCSCLVADEVWFSRGTQPTTEWFDSVSLVCWRHCSELCLRRRPLCSQGILDLLLHPREQEKEEKMVHKISITLKSRNICWSLRVRLEVVFTSKKLASCLFRPSAK